MTLRQFVKRYKNEIDSYIKQRLNDANMKIEHRERELWVLNDEGLYNWARKERVRI
jgi:hypothetical protein